MDFFNKKNNIPTTRRPVEMRNLRPSTGRTVERTGTVDVARAFALLQQACGKNKVARDFTKQRFHERPGLKRKRLKSERWRARFKLGFRATVQRVQELRAQGW
jgi:ribosomal protein S21